MDMINALTERMLPRIQAAILEGKPMPSRAEVEAMLKNACETVVDAQMLQRVLQAMSQDSTGGGCVGGACKRGGACGGGCDDCKYQKFVKEVGPVPLQTYEQFSNLMNGLPKECWRRCSPMSACLQWYWLQMTNEFGAPRLENVIRLDDEVVPFDVPVVGDGLINFPTVPLAAGQAALIRTTPEQQGPFEPGCLKAQDSWNGERVPGAVDITFYVGPREITTFTLADITNGTLVRYGRTKKLSLWDCGTQCFLLPYPKWMGCMPPPVTYKEALFMLVQVDSAAGENTLRTLDMTVLKAGTDDCNRCLKQCGCG